MGEVLPEWYEVLREVPGFKPAKGLSTRAHLGACERWLVSKADSHPRGMRPGGL